MLRSLAARIISWKTSPAEKLFECNDLTTLYSKIRSEQGIEQKLGALIQDKDFSDIPEWLIVEAHAEKGKGHSAAALLGVWAFEQDREKIRMLSQCLNDGRLSTKGDSRLERDLNHLDMALRLRVLDINLKGLSGMINRVAGSARMVDRALSELAAKQR